VTDPLVEAGELAAGDELRGDPFPRIG